MDGREGGAPLRVLASSTDSASRAVPTPPVATLPLASSGTATPRNRPDEEVEDDEDDDADDDRHRDGDPEVVQVKTLCTVEPTVVRASAVGAATLTAAA